MISYLRHADIDLAAWDRRMAACTNGSWYGLSATLEAAAPGWDALVDEATGAQMPLPWRMKYGIRYLYQPFLIQHLGPFSREPGEDDAARFLHALPKRFRYADIYMLGAAISGSADLRTEERTDHVLRLEGPVEALRAGYSLNHRRSLRKAEQLGVVVERGVGSGRAIDFLEGSEQFTRWGIDAVQRATMRRVLVASEETGTGFGRMVTGDGGPVAAAWFVRSGGSIIFLKGMASANGRDLRAMHALIDDVISEHASSGMLLDFAGGNDPQLARFYSGFGAAPVLYLRALMNRLPPLIRLMKP
ncbi:MAG: GNAT family N-acetyltransferase [Flavobacteriales bacterium]|nr:GNAT family N-acetyltransferase [Flavobacteriales bacterium]